MALALAGCVPDPGGSCSQDEDCEGGAPGLFCAEGVCQAPPRATFDELPPALFARAQTATVRVRVERAHGGVEEATASLLINGTALDPARETGGRLRFDVPLRLAPSGIEAKVPFDVSVLDDLGHATVLSGSLAVDDLAPRVFIDASSVPSQAVARGTVVHLRAHVFDASTVALQTSPATALAPEMDGSFRMSVDTGALDPTAVVAEAVLTAVDAVGLRGSASARFAVTK
ncbi:MAG TPA: hypothetical protein VKB92_11230 [Myxococcales bacterium]|nr:hypothetical protein [Myxococcales bacterium]